MKFRQDTQDEGCLDPRIDDCASWLADSKKCTDADIVIKEWISWKKSHKRDTYSQMNKL